jgi:hypothetical protein
MYGFLRTIIAACLIAFSAAAIAANADPAVGVQLNPNGVEIEGKQYGAGDVAALRAKLDEIRARRPKPALSLSMTDGLSDADGEKGMDLLFKAGIEQDIDN